MKQLLKRLTLVAALFVTSLGIFGILTVSPVAAAVDCKANPNDPSCATTTLDAKKQACDGLDATGSTGCGTSSGSFSDVVIAIINVLTVVVGAVCVVMIIIGGFRYVISAGDSNSTAGAKNTILYALVGLVVVIFARTIVAFVLSRV